MENILIIPPDNPGYLKNILKLAEKIKSNYPDLCISILVTTETYDDCYNSDLFDGLIIYPAGVMAKLYLFEPEQFDFVLMPGFNIIWFLACFRAGIHKKIYFPTNLTEKNLEVILSKLAEII